VGVSSGRSRLGDPDYWDLMEIVSRQHVLGGRHWEWREKHLVFVAVVMLLKSERPLVAVGGTGLPATAI
jgi:hypothetical protein